MARYVIDGGAYMSSLFPFGQYALRMTCRETPKMLMIDTVRASALPIMTDIRKRFDPFTKEIRQLHLDLREYEMKTIRRWFSWADLIFFPENDLDHDIPIWTRRHLHELISDVFEKDSAVLFASGYSGLWFFEKGYVQKNNTHQFLDSMLDLHHSLFVPHFEKMDQSALDFEIGQKRFQGYALESNTALAHNCGTESFLATSREHKAYRFIQTTHWIQRKDAPMTIIQ